MNALRSQIGAFLSQRSTLTLATIGRDGRPLAASLLFTADVDLNLYWVSGLKSRHSLNLDARPQAAVTIQNETWTWADIAGVQMEGEAAVIPAGPAWVVAWEIYLAKFPFVKDFEAEVARSNFYKFTPRWARLIDNAKGFGYREEMTF